MEKGYIEDGFIVDLTSTKKVSEIIYELSRILDMPESKGKFICLKLGSIDLTVSELTSIKTMISVMNSELKFISTSSQMTLESATSLDIKISEFTKQVNAPNFEETKPQIEVVKALDNLYDDNSQVQLSNDKADEDEILPIVAHNEEIAQEVEKIEIKEETDEEINIKKSEPENLPTLYIKRTVRSGQSISSDGNVIIIGDINPGAEVIAKGDITVWGILGGIAHAGSDGNNYARIRALKLNPVQIRIGEVFARRPDTVNLPYIQKTCEYTPEEAFTYKGSIVIKKIHEEI